MTDKLAWIDEELNNLKETGFYNNIPTMDSPQGPSVIINGKQVLNFCANNYLGLANHPRLVKAASEAMQKFGVGPGAVRSIAGTLSLHVELEKRMAAFKRVQDAITFQSGFTANGATIPALVGKEDVIFSDELNHASIIDGSRLSGAKILRFAHADVEDFERVVNPPRGVSCGALTIRARVSSSAGA